MVTYHAFPVGRPLEMGIEVLRHKEWLAAGADDGLCCSSMLPKKKLLHPVLGGLGQTNRPSWVLAAASITRPKASAGAAAPREASTAAASSWMVSTFNMLKEIFSIMHSKHTQYHSSNYGVTPRCIVKSEFF